MRGWVRKRRQEMSLKVVDTHERDAAVVRETLGRGDADAECADQSWSIGDGDGPNVAKIERRVLERLVKDWDDGFNMCACSHFRHDSAPLLVQIDLAADDVRQDASAERDRGARFVATCLDAKNRTFKEHEVHLSIVARNDATLWARDLGLSRLKLRASPSSSRTNVSVRATSSRSASELPVHEVHTISPAS